MSDDEKFRLMRELLMVAVRFWKSHIWPVPIDEIFYMPTGRVRVRIDVYRRPDDTQPIGERKV